jgi:RNA polymerase sigma-70 factor (ECF subfamily)
LPRHAGREARPDAELLSAVASGDLGALGDLYDRYHADIWRLVHRMTDGSGEVDDIVQATFLALPRLATVFDGRDSCRAWLCGIAVGLAARQRRGVARLLRRIASFGEMTPTTTTADPEREAGAREELRAFERALARLPWKKREAFVLVELEGLSMAEVAHALRVPAGTVRTRLFHAKRELRQVLARGDR